MRKKKSAQLPFAIISFTCIYFMNQVCGHLTFLASSSSNILIDMLIQTGATFFKSSTLSNVGALPIGGI